MRRLLLGGLAAAALLISAPAPSQAQRLDFGYPDWYGGGGYYYSSPGNYYFAQARQELQLDGLRWRVRQLEQTVYPSWYNYQPYPCYAWPWAVGC